MDLDLSRSKSSLSTQSRAPPDLFCLFVLHLHTRPSLWMARCSRIASRLFTAHAPTLPASTTCPIGAVHQQERWVKSRRRHAGEPAPAVQEPGGGDRQPVHAAAVQLELAPRGRPDVHRVQRDAERGVGPTAAEVQAAGVQEAGGLAAEAVVPVRQSRRGVQHGQCLASQKVTRGVLGQFWVRRQ